MDYIKIVRDLGVSKKHAKHNDDVFIDRLNYRYTVAILCVFSIVVTSAQYFGAPMHCWVPGHFTGNYERYAEKICWVSNTYNVPMGEDIPHHENDRKVKMLRYYQWTPFIFLFQALLFYLPRMIWRSMNNKSGLDIQSLIDVVHNYETDAAKSVEREKLLTYLTASFDRYVSSMRERKQKNREYDSQTDGEDDYGETLGRANNDELLDDVEKGEYEGKVKESKCKKFLKALHYSFRVFCITKGKRYGNFLLALFIFVKLLYTANSISQLFLLNQFLGNDYLILGIEVLSKIWYGEDWSQLKRFPRVTLCDFRIREVGIVHRYTVQCVLSINLFNEKIFIFVWYWLCFISIFNIIDLISWAYTLLINSHERYMYVKRRIMSFNKPPAISGARQPKIPPLLFDYKGKKTFQKFVNGYLKEDGVLALRLLSRNAHDLIVAEVISKLYDLYLERKKCDEEATVVLATDDYDNDANNTRSFARKSKHENVKLQTVSENA